MKLNPDTGLILKRGSLAYWDTFGGLIPVKVLSISGPSGRPSSQQEVSFILSATRGAYKKGERQTSWALHVIPRAKRSAMNPRITLPDGREFPEFEGKPLSWDPGSHFTLDDERKGYPKTKAVLMELSDSELQRHQRENLRASFGNIFSGNAKRFLKLIEEEIERRGKKNPKRIGERKGPIAELSDISHIASVSANFWTGEAARGQQRIGSYTVEADDPGELPRRNPGLGTRMVFHGAFASAAQAERKKAKMGGGFVKVRKINGQTRYIVMTHATHAIQKARYARRPAMNPKWDQKLHFTLIHAITEWDIKQSTKRGYNPYALAQYLAAVDEIEKDIAKGKSVEDAIRANLLDSLRDFVLKEVAKKFPWIGPQSGYPHNPGVQHGPIRDQLRCSYCGTLMKKGTERRTQSGKPICTSCAFPGKKNPPGDRVIYQRCLALYAVKGRGHKCDTACMKARHTYKHDFGTGVRVIGLANGDVLLSKR